MKYLSLFSGIEAATVAWEPLGWECVGVSEILPYQSSVIAHHYPHIKNFGDVTKITEDDMKSLGKFDVVIFGSPCFPAGTLVLTDVGYVPIEDIKESDMVLTHKGRWRKVLRVGGTIKDTVMMKGFGHPNLEASLDHPFLSTKKSRVWNNSKRGYDNVYSDASWTEAKDMAGNYWATPLNIESLKIPEFRCDLSGYFNKPPVISDSFWWMVGRWLGDGWLATGNRLHRPSNHNKVIICCGKHEDISDELKATDLTWNFSEERTTYRYSTNNKALCDWLLDNFGQYSDKKHIPSWVYGLDESSKLALLKGYHSADGCTLKDGQHKISTVSKSLAFGIRLLLENLGYSTSLYYGEDTRENHMIEGRLIKSIKPSYSIRWYSDKDKPNIQYKDNDYSWNSVRSVVNTNETKIVYNIEVEEDNTYVVENIIVHNCQDLSVAGKQQGLEAIKEDTNHSSILFFEGMRVFRLAQEHCGARFLVWENVPGALNSNNGVDFGKIINTMVGVEFNSDRLVWGNEGMCCGNDSLLEWSVLDAQWFGVAQRRRRLFLVLDTGDWSNRSTILLESKSLRGDTPPSNSSRTGVTKKAKRRISSTISENLDTFFDDVIVETPVVEENFCFDMQAFGVYGNSNIASTVKGRDYKDATDLIVETEYACAISSNIIDRKVENGGNHTGYNEDVMYTLTGADHHAIAYMEHPKHHVRKLTPIEVERLQGFPDGWTDVNSASFSKRINALGRSMAVPVIQWIGKQIEKAY